MKIGIIEGSVRVGRNATAVAKWVLDFAQKRNDAGVEYEIVALADYDLPLLGAKVPAERQEEANKHIQAWSEKIASFDAYIVVAPEYNHAIGGALKNALDYLKPEITNKTAGLVGYGSLGGARAHENLRSIFAELKVFTARTAITFSLVTDFKNMSEFAPQPFNEVNATNLLDELIPLTEATKVLR